jgi:hypothetical protein
MMPTDAPSQQRHMPGLDNPATRPLKVFAFDPSHGRLLGNQMSMAIRYEELDPGPVVRDPMARDGIAVVDYDATNRVYYEPVNLDDPRILIRGGLDPRESDPKFHQQMVYAVATDTIQHFENALGRRIHWRRVEPDHTKPDLPNQGNIYTLNIYPHAMMAANAFYSPRARGVLFGYFKADKTNPGRNLPGQTVFTCLSHDIIVHEMTHAIIDGIRGHFMEQTNPDVAAFHEAFADIVALFRHFSHTEVLIDAIQRTGGALFDAQLAAAAPVAPGATPSIGAQIAGRNPLVDLAQQFGEATGRGRGLRSALETPPNSDDIRNKFEPHARGSILVSAIFDAFFTTYVRETTDLFRIYRSGGGGTSDVLPDALTRLLAQKASGCADLFFKVCVRALDYCPPVDITFGDFLRAVITSDFDLHPDDSIGLRDAFMQAFRVRGIVPEGSAFFSDVAIAWPPAPKDLPPINGLVFGDPNGLTRSQQDASKHALQTYVDDEGNRERLDFDPVAPITIPSFHPVFRINQDGSLRTDMVVEAIQEVLTPFDPKNPNLGSFPLRGGATMIISKPPLSELRQLESHKKAADKKDSDKVIDYGRVRFVIAKHLHGDVGERRASQQRAEFARLGLVAGTDPDRFQINFALTHGGF